MAKSPPEKLAAALRANLLRRKQGAAAKTGPAPSKVKRELREKPPKTSA
jgi:hypothetical protein